MVGSLGEDTFPDLGVFVVFWLELVVVFPSATVVLGSSEPRVLCEADCRFIAVEDSTGALVDSSIAARRVKFGVVFPDFLARW